jgi:hypothetical protein
MLDLAPMEMYEDRQSSSRGNMDRQEIASALATGAGRQVCVLLDRPSLVPGYVRSISIHSKNRIQVAFEVEGFDEGGAYFRATYESLDLAIAALEELLQMPVSEWRRPSLDPPADDRAAPDHAALSAAIKTGSLRFPAGATFKLESSYWEQFLPGAQDDEAKKK